MKAIIAGSTGEVGKHLNELLLRSDKYSEVIRIVRSDISSRHDKEVIRSINFNDIASIPKASADAFFCCLGTTIRKAGSQENFRKVDYEYVVELAKWAKNSEIEQFHVVSALGANAKSSIFYNKVKGQMENSLKEIGFSSLYIYQPSLLDSERTETRMGEKVGIILFRLINPLLIGPLKKYRSIKVQKVAEGMIKRSLAAEEGNHTILSSEI